jgi:hypothetical protein
MAREQTHRSRAMFTPAAWDSSFLSSMYDALRLFDAVMLGTIEQMRVYWHEEIRRSQDTIILSILSK